MIVKDSYMTKGDMATRWGVSRQTIYNWETRRPDFPLPAFRLAGGKIPVYAIEDIKRYEKKFNISVVESGE